MGAYTAFLDVALGFGTPLLGFLAERGGIGSASAKGAALGLDLLQARRNVVQPAFAGFGRP
jgi:hypothetical protein